MSEQSKHETFYSRLSAAAFDLPYYGKSLFLYPHINADGDALGSALAFALLMEQFGVDCLILTEEPVNTKLSFLPEASRLIVSIEEGQDLIATYADRQGLGLVIDSPGGQRIGKRLALFDSAEQQFTIDHHIPTKEVNEFTLVDTSAAASCEMVTEYILYLEQKHQNSFLTEAMAINLFCGLMTDTGRFTYSNTTANTMTMAAELLRFRIDIRELSLRLFDSISKAKLALSAYVFSEAQYFYDNRMIVSLLPYTVFAEHAGDEGDVEGLVAVLRDVIGIDIAILLRETERGGYRVSVRSGEGFDAQSLAMQFKGGGHLRASGYTLKKMPAEEAIALSVEATKPQFKG